MAAKTEKGLKQEIVNLFPVRLRQILEALPLDFARLEEIRLRCGQPILFRSRKGNGNYGFWRSDRTGILRKTG